jgi:hypothetical protein
MKEKLFTVEIYLHTDWKCLKQLHYEDVPETGEPIPSIQHRERKTETNTGYYDDL